MQTNIHPRYASRHEMAEAESILGKCVHCGFCNATCPTYQLLGDELDGPRGRIYLIKNIMEEGQVSSAASLHLDRCLTCRACETTCPSGVEYGRLLDISRGLMADSVEQNNQKKNQQAQINPAHNDQADQKKSRQSSDLDEASRQDESSHIRIDPEKPHQAKQSLGSLTSHIRPERQIFAKLTISMRLERLGAQLLLIIIPRRWLLSGLLGLGRLCRPVLPAWLARKIPPAGEASQPSKQEGQKQAGAVVSPDYILLGGCVQSVVTPSVNMAAQQLLEGQGKQVQLLDIPCCGSLHHHYGHHQVGGHGAGKEFMKQVIKACADYPDLPIISTATGCGVTLRDYGQLFSGDPEAESALAFSNRVLDLSEVLEDMTFDCEPLTVALHTPCTMQHGLRLGGKVEAILSRAGFQVMPTREAHLCCGSAGAWSILHPRLAAQLLARKIAALTKPHHDLAQQKPDAASASPVTQDATDASALPDVIVTANIGCQLHLASGTDLPVMHWVELLHQQLRD